MSKKVVTRFAPSPTGFLHIGGARTALFNWLFARHHQGEMLLRIEDTDRARSNEAAVAAILDGLSWLGLSWDGEAISQYSRVERHQEVAKTMVENGVAYYCYATPEELETMRDAAKAEGRPSAYDGRWRDRDPAEAPAGVSPVIRIKTPQEGETLVEDQVQGSVRIPNKDIDDFVILRSDGTPTYMLAVVVDDHDMGVTHVIRGDDHLTNAARQTTLFQAMGWQVPTFAHIPLIHGPDGAKLSKRHGALGAEAYRDMGFLPDALCNYLIRLGWAKGDEEIISRQNMIEWFGFEGMGKAAARFDLTKLEALNAHYIRQSTAQDLYDHIRTMLLHKENGRDTLTILEDPVTREKILRFLPALKERAKTLNDLLEGSAFLYAPRPLILDEKAQSLMSEETRQTLQELAEALKQVDSWTYDTIKETMQQFLESAGLKLGKIGPALRGTLTGTTNAPGIYEIMEALGKQEVLARISDQTSQI